MRTGSGNEHFFLVGKVFLLSQNSILNTAAQFSDSGQISRFPLLQKELHNLRIGIRASKLRFLIFSSRQIFSDLVQCFLPCYQCCESYIPLSLLQIGLPNLWTGEYASTLRFQILFSQKTY